MQLRKAPVIIGLISSLWASQSLAHHAMGGDTPANLVQGLLSGLAHPVIGIDHFAFLIAMGIAAVFTSRALLTPFAFITATIAGCLLAVAGFGFAGVEIGVATSVVFVGAMVLSGKQFGGAVTLGLFTAAGILHGMAYAGAIIGAEATPLAAYLAGFACVQYAIAVAAGMLARRFADTGTAAALQPRLAGAVATGVGIAILVENIEGLFVIA